MNFLKGTRITWLGHATVLVQTPKGTNILIDPFIEHNPKYPKNFKLPEKIQYVLLTHGHGDHMSDAVPVAKKHKSNVVAIYELAAYVNKEGAENITGMNIGGTVQLDDVAVTMVEAKHSAGVEGKSGSQYAGVAAGFVLTISRRPSALSRRRHHRLRRYEADQGSLSSGACHATDRRLLHHGTEGSRAGRSIPGTESDSAHPLRNLSAAYRNPRSAGWTSQESHRSNPCRPR